MVKVMGFLPECNLHVGYYHIYRLLRMVSNMVNKQGGKTPTVHTERNLRNANTSIKHIRTARAP